MLTVREAVKMLPDTVGDYSLTKLLLPVAFGEAASAVLSKAADIQPDAILCIGQAGGRAICTVLATWVIQRSSV